MPIPISDTARSIVESVYLPQYYDDFTEEQFNQYLVAVQQALDTKNSDSLPPEFKVVVDQYIEWDEILTEAVDAQPKGLLGQLSAHIQAWFASMFEGLGTTLVRVIVGVAKPIVQSILQWMVGDNDARTQGFWDAMKATGVYDGDAIDQLQAFASQTTLSSIVTSAWMIVGVISAQLQIMFHTATGDYIKQANAIFTPNQLDIDSLIAALHIAPEKTDDINQKLKENGLSDSDIELAKIARYRLQDLNTLQMAYWRGAIDINKVHERLSELGFTPERQEEILATWEIIPPPQDLFTLVAHEAFEPDQIAQFGLGDEFPNEQVEWLEKQGISSFWAHKYWAGHWTYPSPQQVLDLLHRGLIDEALVYQYYRVVEMPPFWRNKLMQASYTPYTRVDTRRMYDLNIINEQDVYDAYRAQGYDDEHALHMTEFTIRYDEGNDKLLTQTQITNAYKYGLISYDDAVGFLSQLGYTDASANFIISYVDFQEQLDLQQAQIKNIENEFKQRFISEGQAYERITALGVTATKAQIMLDTWKLSIEKSMRRPTKAELDKMFAGGYIDEANYMTELAIQGYAPEYISIYLAMLKATL